MIADFYAISIASVFKIDKWVYNATLPPPLSANLKKSSLAYISNY